MQLVRGARLHPVGEPFVEPQVVPPRHGHQVAEPLVRDLVRGNGENVLLVVDVGRGRVQQQRVLEGEDRPPVFHCAEELALPGCGDVVQLRQRIWNAEIRVVFMQHVAPGIQCELRLVHLALLRDHANLGAIVGLARRPLEVADTQKQQVRGHLGRGLEGHALHATGTIAGRGDRHVAHRHLRGRRNDCQVERGLEIGLVPRRNEAARIGIFELGKQRAALALWSGVIQRE